MKKNSKRETGKRQARFHRLLQLCLCSFVVLAGIFVSSLCAFAATYYVDAVNGSDTADGLTTATAWKTISKVNATTFAAGDQILLKCGSTFRETTLQLLSSGSSTNRITIGSYGTGNKPILSGGRIITGWTQYSGTIYQASLPLTTETYLVTSNNQSLTRSTTAISSGLAAGAFRWENNVLYVNDPAGNPDTLGKVIEAAVIDSVVKSSGKSYITIDGIRMTMTGGALVSMNANKAKYWIIKNCELEFCQSGYNTSGAFHLSSVQYITISNNVIRNVFADGIMIWNSSDVTASGNNISKVYKGIETGCDGIQSAGSTATSSNRNRIIDNYIDMQGLNTGKGCIQQESGTDAYIAGNTCLYGNYGVECNSDNGIVEKNFCAYQGVEDQYTWSSGLYLSEAANYSNMIWRYNVVYNAYYNGISFLQNYTRTNFKVYNNTVYNSGNGFKSVGPISGEFKNNILWTTPTSYLYNVASIISGQTFISDYNIIGQSTTGKNIRYSGVSYDTLSAFYAATGNDLNSSMANPLFINAANQDLHLSATSPALDTGMDLSLTTDIENAVVPQGNGPNRGAYETVGVNVNDGLIAYEGFDYSAGAYLNGLGGMVNGWSGNWTVSTVDQATVGTGSDTYTEVTSLGNKGLFKTTCSRPLTNALGFSNSGTVWMSFIARNNNSGRDMRINLTSQGVNKITMRQQNAYTWRLNDVDTLKGSYNQLAFVLLKIDFRTNGRTVSAWINPNLSGGEVGLGTADATWSGTEAFTLNGMSMTMSTGTTTSAQIDEIRIGSNFINVLKGTTVQ